MNKNGQSLIDVVTIIFYVIILGMSIFWAIHTSARNKKVLAEKTTRIDNICTELDWINADVDKLNRVLDELEGNINKISDDIDKIETQIKIYSLKQFPFNNLPYLELPKIIPDFVISNFYYITNCPVLQYIETGK